MGIKFSLVALAMLATFATAQTLHPPALIRLIQTPRTGFDIPMHSGDAASGIELIGATSLTGHPETWEIETHSSFTGLEEFDAGRPPSVEKSAQAKTLIAFHRQWWSNRPDEAIQALRRARYLQVSWYRIAVGTEQEFAELLRARKAALDSMNIDRPDMVYQVIAGAPSGTFIVISPLLTLKQLDEGVTRSAAAYLRSTNTPSGKPAASQIEISHENLLFRIDPKISSVSADFASSDPRFWKPMN